MAAMPRWVLAVLFVLTLLVPPGGASETTARQGQDSAAAYYAAWFADVAPLASAAERSAFLRLTTDDEREAFVRGFWRVRDPTPGTPRNEAWERWSSRSLDTGSASQDDRARVEALTGAQPDWQRTFPACPPLRPLEVWHFAARRAAPGGETDSSGNDLYIVFVHEGQGFQIWQPSDGLETLLATGDAAAESPERKTQSAKRTGKPSEKKAESPEQEAETPQQVVAAARLTCSADASVWTTLLAALDEAAGMERLSAWAGERPPPEQWLDPALQEELAAPALPVSLALAYPGTYRDKTVVEGRLVVPREGPSEPAGEPVDRSALMVTGEVVRQGTFVDRFQYRFDLSTLGASGSQIPLRFYRQLAPGSYLLALRLDDGHGRSLWHAIRGFTVPTVDREGLPSGVNPELLSVLFVEGFATSHSLEIIPPGPGPQVGEVSAGAVTTGPDVAEVRYALDGKAVGSSREPPYRVELDLGHLPRRHTLHATALDPDGRTLAEDEVRINDGPHRFAVRLVELARGKPRGDVVRVRAAVEVPDGAKLDRVELFLNDDRAAVLYQPPFVQTLRVPPGNDLAYVRVVAYLADGRSSEAVSLLRAPDVVDKVDVQLVQLFTTVVDWRGRLVTGLDVGDFEVFDEGVEQKIQRFERVEDLPIQVLLLIDTSDSMGSRLPEVRRSALRFFANVLTPKDRAAVITFNHQIRIVARFTNDVKTLEASTEGLIASGGTALYDSLIRSLYYFKGVEGRRALVLLSDGEDVHSRYTYQDVLEYAKRSGVAIYPIALEPGSAPVHVRDSMLARDRQHMAARYTSQLQELASESGGRFFSIRSVEGLDRVCRILEQELRSQYLLAYPVPKGAGSDFRRVEVRVAGHGRHARTMGGYYPN